MLFRTRWYSGNVFEGDESVCVSGCLYVGSTLVLVTMLLSGCRIPVVRLLWEQVDRVQFPASRQWYCLTVQGTVVVPKEMETGFLVCNPAGRGGNAGRDFRYFDWSDLQSTTNNTHNEQLTT